MWESDLMKDTTIVEVLKHLSTKGIVATNGCFSFNPEQVVDYIKDQDEFMSKQYGMTKEVYVGWQNHVDIQCSALTAKGNRCKNIVFNNYSFHDPAEYMKRAAKGCYCHLHGGKDGRSKYRRKSK